MDVVSVRIYKKNGEVVPRLPTDPRILRPENLIQTLTIPVESRKPLNKNRAKRLIARALGSERMPALIWEHADGWIADILHSGERSWALITAASDA